MIKYNSETIQSAIRLTAQQLVEQGVHTPHTVYIVLLNGGAWFASHFFDCLGNIPNIVYYAKCHSYEGQERQVLVWDYIPDMQLNGKDVVVLDDICDSGQTATEVVRYLQQYADKVTVVTLLKRTTTCLPDDISLHSCLTDDSQDFFVGCGMDDNGFCRMQPYISIS